jgi:hypothetical protein
MKGTLFALATAACAVLLASCSTLPPWKSVPTGQQAEYGSVETDTDLIQFIAFSDDEGITALGIKNKEYTSPARYAILLDAPARGALKEACEKYENWKDIAQKNQTEITKTIATLDLTQMYYQEGGWHDAGDLEISLVFTSTIDDSGTQSISLSLKPSPIYMRRSFFRMYGREPLVLRDDQVKAFSDLLQEDAVNNG